jgi:hypothetical protein
MSSEPSASSWPRRVDALGQSMTINIHSSTTSTRVDTLPADSVFTDDDAFVGDIDVPSPFTDTESVLDVTVAIKSDAYTPQSQPKGPSFEIWVYRLLAAVAALYFAADFIAYETHRLLDKWGPLFDQIQGFFRNLG